MLNVAVIDDGINNRLYDTGGLQYDFEITPELTILERSDYDKYLPSHGTTCAAIMKKYSPGIGIGSIKVLNDGGRALRDQLIAALYWCADNGVKLVNLSLGTIDFRDNEAMRQAVNEVYRKGVIIVAACNNKNVYTYPASLSNVIGVKADLEEKLKEGQYHFHYYPLDGIEITACAAHSLMKYDNNLKTTSSCNSFATPMITAVVYNILKQNPGISLEDLKKELANGAVNEGAGQLCDCALTRNLYQQIDWVENAAVFQIHGAKEKIINIPYKFPVQNVIDIECGTKGEGVQKVQDFLKENMMFTDEIDTFVVNINNSTGPGEETELVDLIETLDNLNKNLVYLDDYTLSQDEYHTFRSGKIKLFHPFVYSNIIAGEKSVIDLPVIVVYDFSGTEFLNIISELRVIFRENGYYAVAVSDTCKGIVAEIEYLADINNIVFGHITLEHINRVYDPGIILIGINASSKKEDYLKSLENGYEIDLKIIIPDEKNRCTLGSNLESKREIIIRAMTDKDETARILNLSHENYIGELYRYIIELFEEDGSLL